MRLMAWRDYCDDNGDDDNNDESDDDDDDDNDNEEKSGKMTRTKTLNTMKRF